MNPSSSEKTASSEQLSNWVDPYVDLLYEEGDPHLVLEDAEECSQTPLYDNLRALDQRYTDQTLIAKGGMKEIYRALDQRTSRHIAIARPLEAHGEDYYDAFLREAHITAKLEHPGIIKLFGMDVDEEGVPFFTMEFKTGRSLRKIINDYKKGNDPEYWSLTQRLHIILRICESLAYAHSQRVLHLDIKPDNIQIGSFAEVQLCDWGMGVVIQGEENNQSETLLDPDLYGSLQRKIRGTPLYMAPELFDAKNVKTEQMDIYSLGCLIEELIHAEPPQSEKKQYLSKESPLNAVIEKAKAKTPSQRYASVSQIHRDISNYLEGFSMSVEEPSLRRELSLFYKRHQTVSNIILLSLFTLIAAGSLFLYSINNSRNKARESRDHALKSLAALEKEKAQSENRLQEQVNAAQIGTTQLIHLEITDSLDMPTLVSKLHEQVDSVIANQPAHDSPIWKEKFWLHFLTQNFDQALRLHEEGKHIPEDLLPLAQKFSSRIGNTEQLNTADFNELLIELFAIEGIGRKALANKMTRYDLKNSRSIDDRVKISHQMLKLLNPHWEKQTFTYSQADSSLKLSGKKLKYLSLNKNHPSVLKIIDPIKLDLRGAYMTSLESLSSLHLTEIDLRQTPVRSLTPLAKMRTLRRIIITPEQFSQQQLSVLPSWVKAVVKK